MNPTGTLVLCHGLSMCTVVQNILLSFLFYLSVIKKKSEKSIHKALPTLLAFQLAMALICPQN